MTRFGDDERGTDGCQQLSPLIELVGRIGEYDVNVESPGEHERIPWHRASTVFDPKVIDVGFQCP